MRGSSKLVPSSACANARPSAAAADDYVKATALARAR
jgi:hypothetical protein